MKISGTGKTGGVSKTTSSPSSASRQSVSAPKAAESAGPADTVEISDHAQAVEAIRGLVASAPDMRTAEVNRIAMQLSQGRYKIDYHKVAESFIRHVIAEEIASKKKKKGHSDAE